MGDRRHIATDTKTVASGILVPEFKELEELKREAGALGAGIAPDHPDESLYLERLRCRAGDFVDTACAVIADQLEPLIRHLEGVKERLDADRVRGQARLQEDEAALRQAELDHAKPGEAAPRRPGLGGLVLLGIGLAFGFGLVAMPTVHMLWFIEPESGLPVPGAALFAFLAASLVGAVLTGATFYSALYPVKSFLFRHFAGIAGVAAAVAIAVMRARQLGGFNGFAIGLALLELAVVGMIEAVAAVHRHHSAAPQALQPTHALLAVRTAQRDRSRSELAAVQAAFDKCAAELVDAEQRQRFLATYRDPLHRRAFVSHAVQELHQAFRRGQLAAQQGARS